INLYIAGVGEYETVVQKYVEKDKRIKYFGFVSGKKKEELYLESDVFVLPSEWFEVSPVTIQEAYGYGLPVLATDFGSIPEHIEIGKTGWIFKIRNTSDLAEKISMIYSQRENLEKIRENCFESSLKNNFFSFIEKVCYIQGQIVKK
ncbi:MAG: glycosyltransferase, partial [candidate division WOR-3 bacterium]